MKTIVLGLGNPILTDDAAGIRVVRELHGKAPEEVTLAEANLGGLNLLEFLAGYDKAIIVDSIQTLGGKPGAIYRLTLQDLSHAQSQPLSASHTMSLPVVLELGRGAGMELPREIAIYAIEVEDPYTFGEGCTTKVEAAIHNAAEMVLRELQPPVDQ